VVPARPRLYASFQNGQTWSIALTLGFAIWLSRVFLLGHGYGTDADAWRAMLAAQHLLDTGHYLPSRPPGYPLPEYFDAFMLRIGLGSAFWIGLSSSILSGLSAALLFRLCGPLGSVRALLATLALSFTPEVYVAGLGAMDYLWGLTFFLGASLCAFSGRVWRTALLLGLAAASRPTYALGFIPLALILIEFDLKRLTQLDVWKKLVTLGLVSGGITLAFFVPVIMEIGERVIKVPESEGSRLQLVIYNSTLSLFGVAGFFAVAVAIVLAWRHRAQGVTLSARQSRQLDGWAWTLVVLYGLLFVRLPDEGSYLMPALLGLYWLLARYAPLKMLWGLAVTLALSCFLLRLGHDVHHARTLLLGGPVAHELALQHERRCVASVVKQRLAESPDGLDYVVTAEYRPQLLVEIGPPLASRVLYTVRPAKDQSGQLVDTEGVPMAKGARLILLDRATVQQADAWGVPDGLMTKLDSYKACPPTP